MKESNGLENIISQALDEMKSEQGNDFSLERINLAELERRTGVSRAKLRRLKANNFSQKPHGLVGQKQKSTVLSGYSVYLDKLLSQGITNSVVCLDRLQAIGFEGSLSTVKRYIKAHKHLVPAKVDAYYHNKEQKRVPLSQQKEFRAIKNAVIKEAENIRQCKLFFEDKGVEQESEPEEFRNESYDYWTLRDVIRDDTLTMDERGEAISEMETLAKTGDKHAQYLMGKLWRDGPLLTPNPVNARHWFQQAAEQGHSYAQYALGKLLLSDDVEVRDPAKGLRWLETAAQSGNDYAAYRLGKEYYRGKNVERSFTVAAKWFDRAAQDGNQYAQYMLGKLYLMGQGVEYDKSMGAYWLSQSAAQGNVYAEKLLQHQNSGRPPNVFLGITRLLHHMGRIFQERSLPRSNPGGIQIDRKRLEELMEKREAHGLKGNMYEEYRGPTMSM